MCSFKTYKFIQIFNQNQYWYWNWNFLLLSKSKKFGIVPSLFIASNCKNGGKPLLIGEDKSLSEIRVI